MKSLNVPGTLNSLGAIAQYVMQAAEAAGLDKRSAYRLRLAVDEIATNIIVHGYAEAKVQGELTLESMDDGKALTISIEDTAAECDPRVVPSPDIHLSAEQRPIGGLGVYLALQSVDKFDYERTQGRNRNVLTMNLPVPSHDGGANG